MGVKGIIDTHGWVTPHGSGESFSAVSLLVLIRIFMIQQSRNFRMFLFGSPWVDMSTLVVYVILAPTSFRSTNIR